MALSDYQSPEAEGLRLKVTTSPGPLRNTPKPHHGNYFTRLL